MKSYDKNNKIVYVDLDDTMANFFKSAGDLSHPNLVDERKMYDPDFFFKLEPIPGALRNVRGIMQLGYDVWILTQPLANDARSYEQKVRWVNTWIPELADKIIMTQHKGLHVGHYLIDDREDKWKKPFEKNGGKFVHFPYDRFNPSTEDLSNKWESIYQFFLNELSKS